MASSARTQDLVDIDRIENGVIYLKGGAMRKIVMVDGINFDLKSDEEQSIIIQTYQNLINALDFSIQINVHSRKLNIDGYLENLRNRLAKETNELLKIQLEEYLDFVTSFVKGNAIMAKSFFIIVPYDPVSMPTTAKRFLPKALGGKVVSTETTETGENKDIQTSHHNQLQQRVDEIITNLREIGLRAIALEDPELIEIYFDYYNPSVVESRGAHIATQSMEGSSASLADIVAPSAIEVSPNHLRIGDKLTKTFFVYNYPRYLSSGWFSPVINLPNLMDISIFIHPTSTGVALRGLRKKAAQIESQIMTNQEKGIVRSPALETALQDIEALRDTLQRSEEKLFSVGVYITIHTETEEEMDKLSSGLINMLDNKLFSLNPDYFSYTMSKSALRSATEMMAMKFAGRDEEEIVRQAKGPGERVPANAGIVSSGLRCV